MDIVDLQKARDLLTAVEEQRNFFVSQVAMLHAELIAAHRRIAELEKGTSVNEPEGNGDARLAR